MELKSKEETITMSTSDFKQLIADEVNRTLKQQEKSYTPQNVFNSVKIRAIDIKAINYQSEVALNWIEKQSENKCSRVYDGAIYTQNIFNTSNWGSTYKVADRDIHELLRRLAVTVLGHSVNGEIRFDEFELAQSYYNEFKNVWLGLYKQRLSDMEENK